jgi:hypothetical protein
MISRRTLLGSLAALPLLAHTRLDAAAARVGGARILLLDNRLWMQVRFGDRGPFTFVVDTGAWVNLIKRDVARELHLKELGSVLGTGAGGKQQFTLYEGQNVTLGNIDIGTADFAGYDGDMIHPEAAGALASNLLTTADSDLDFELGEWRIYPGGRGERSGFERLPSEIRASATRRGSPPIYVDAAIDGRTFRLQVDTGAPGQISLWASASRRSGLWNEGAPYVPIRRGGIGGEGAMGRIVRGREAKLGGIGFDRPLILLTDPDSSNQQEGDGLLGLHLIQQMNLSTDVGAHKLWAKRNARPAPPERYGLSGLWVEEREGRLVIVALSPQSPAAEAGLRIGDEIPGVALKDWVRRLAGRPGETVDIDYRRSGEAGKTRLTLREYI